MLNRQKIKPPLDEVALRELEYYENFYNGSAGEHFSKPAVVAFRRYLTRRLLRVTGAGQAARVLSIGCGLGDGELLLARHVAHVTGVDLSPRAIEYAKQAAHARRIGNVSFIASPWQQVAFARRFDLIVAIFFLHHLPDEKLEDFTRSVRPLLNPGGKFYALEPSAWRLSGMVGKFVVPRLMQKYQTHDERQMHANRVVRQFRESGFAAGARWFDFISTPLAGLFPGWAAGYRAARWLDEGLTQVPGLRKLSSNFELIANG